MQFYAVVKHLCAKISTVFHLIESSCVCLLQVPCYLQFLNRTHSDSFETYAEFYLSESRSSEVLLPELHGSDSEQVAASDVWRVMVVNQLVDRTTSNVFLVEEITESRSSN